MRPVPMHEYPAPLKVAAEWLSDGQLDGVVAGATNTTADVLRAGLSHLGVKGDPGVITSSFTMVLPGDTERVLTLSDPAVIPSPTPDQLAVGAAAACDARAIIVGDTPRVGFLSFSSYGSASGPEVDRVLEALSAFRRIRPDVPSDGELQADAALVPEVGCAKAPDSPVAGRANVLVFPSLDAANIAYKLIERLAGARALGPILHGFPRQLSDLSRGASVEDIIDVACVTALLAESGHGGAVNNRSGSARRR